MNELQNLISFIIGKILIDFLDIHIYIYNFISNLGRPGNKIRKKVWENSSIIHQKWFQIPGSNHISEIMVIIDNIQQIANAVQKGLYLIVRASFQQGRARLTRLRNELCSDSFHAVLAWSCGRAKCQCCTATVTVVVYTLIKSQKITILRYFSFQRIHQWE